MTRTKDLLLFSENPLLAQAQRLLAGQDYLSFLELAEQAEDALVGEDLGELYLMRAQIKMFYADETMADDLRLAKKLLPGSTRLPTLGTRFRSDSPNVFTVLNPQGGSLSRYKLSLRKSLQVLQAVCGDVSLDLAYLCEAEILYYIGYIDKAIQLAEPIYAQATKQGSHHVAIVAGFILVRCYIAQGETARLELVMNQLIRYAKILSRPIYRELYNKINGWVNCTTGWMGETPRYHIAPNGATKPVLDDRQLALEDEIGVPGRFEEALLQAARHTNPDAYSMKALYINLYEAMVHFKLGKKNQAVAIFYEMYVVTQKNRIIMPFVEYGAQILPLLQYALSRKDSKRFARRWSDKLNQMATQYEASLLVVRGENQQDKTMTEALAGVETAILRLMIQEMTIAEIAEALGLNVQDTKAHIRSIYRKMQVHNRSEAVAKAVGGKILEP